MPKIILGVSADALADAIASHLRTARGPFLVLPGGSSPVEMIQALSRKTLLWSDIKIMMTDERCVPENHEYNNLGQAKRLLGGVGASFISLQDENLIFDGKFSVTVLGMGEDGHFASLFPDDDWEGKTGDIISAKAPAEPKDRLSLTLDRLLQTEHLYLLVNSRTKLELCEAVMNGEKSNLPIAKLFQRSQDKLQIFVLK